MKIYYFDDLYINSENEVIVFRLYYILSMSVYFFINDSTLSGKKCFHVNLPLYVPLP